MYLTCCSSRRLTWTIVHRFQATFLSLERPRGLSNLLRYSYCITVAKKLVGAAGTAVTYSVPPRECCSVTTFCVDSKRMAMQVPKDGTAMNKVDPRTQSQQNTTHSEAMKTQAQLQHVLHAACGRAAWHTSRLAVAISGHARLRRAMLLANSGESGR